MECPSLRKGLEAKGLPGQQAQPPDLDCRQALLFVQCLVSQSQLTVSSARSRSSKAAFSTCYHNSC
eukprot:1128686-Pelagomonas_calceolata.AAC.1